MEEKKTFYGANIKKKTTHHHYKVKYEETSNDAAVAQKACKY